MRSELTSGASGASPYRDDRQAPKTRTSRPLTDRAPVLALLFVLGWSLLRLVVLDGSGFDVERILALLFAVAAAVLLLKEVSLR
jgi:hypothetical protein